MQSNQSKQPTGKIWAKQIPTTQISNLRNNKEHLRKKTKRKTIKQQLLPVRINISYSKARNQTDWTLILDTPK